MRILVLNGSPRPNGNTAAMAAAFTAADVFPNFDGSRAHIFPVFRVHFMVQRCQHDVVTDKAPLANGDTALILKMTPGRGQLLRLHGPAPGRQYQNRLH